MGRAIAHLPRLSAFLIAGWLVAVGSPAGADTINYAKFYAGGSAYGNNSLPFSGAGTVYDDTKSLGTDCPDGHAGCGGADVLGTSLGFSGLGITATVNAVVGNKVWDDLAPPFGGLGVGPGSPSDADQIADDDVLTLTFNTSVTLTGVATLFDYGHTSFGTGFGTPSAVATAAAASGGIAFLLKVGNGSFNPIDFTLANDAGLTGLIGTTFSFKQATDGPEFYVSALKFETCSGPVGCANTPTVPIPGALPLFASGLVGLAWLGRRRRRRSAVALTA